MRYLLAFAVIPLISACSHQHPATTVPVAHPVAAEAPKHDPVVTPVSPHVAVSDDLGQQCGLRLAEVKEAPKFGFNDADLLPEDRSVLQQVASCLTNGPLKGRHLRLTGRADPRGTEEYNLGLGDRRARTVSDYLTRLGLGSSQMTMATRGALDASGSDESGWRLDRRVDLQLI